MVAISPWLAAALGLLFGSFLNVCITRLPSHRSIAFPGSHCPRCKAAIRPADNIPLLSFFLLRGRCRACRKPIPARYPLVEAGLGLLFALAAVRFPAPGAFAAAAVLCFLLLGLLVMDAETFLLPDTLTLPGAALGLVEAASLAQFPPALALLRSAPFAVPHWPAFESSLAGALAGAGSLLLLRWAYWLVRHREGMGLGDVKLAGLLGAWLGITGVALSLALGVLLASLAALGVLVARGGRANVGQMRLPFGSFLAAAGLLTVFAGRQVLRFYFSFWT